ncbi:MAG: polyprenyl diphosphate synthase [Buchnera aphidicola (Chaetogeoica yunlongensis)]
MLLKNLLKYNKKIPMHVAIIMDGNGRWAKKNGKSRVFGHFAGFKAAKKAISCALFYKLKKLTLYAFSSENWDRPILEIKVLMELFFYALSSELAKLNKYNIRLKIIGDKQRFNNVLRDRMDVIENSTIKNNGLILNIAANYGGRWEIVEVIKKLLFEIKAGRLSESDITESTISKFLLIKDDIPVDLVIRTGGEYRLSNFLIWQITYSELYFTNLFWPDFNRKEFERAICFFLKRKRRFGKINVK